VVGGVRHWDCGGGGAGGGDEVICIGGPAAGILIESNERRVRFPEAPTLMDLRYAHHEQANMRGLRFTEHEYEVQRVVLRWGNVGEFAAYAFVHASITDRKQVDRAVLMAFFGALMEATADKKAKQ
jgi:(p)ppGpp synthase/HD superfamily hydrolase